MKKVYVIFLDRANPKAIDFILGDLSEVFEDLVVFEACYIGELKTGEKLTADAYLVTANSLYDRLREHITDFSTLIKLQRSPHADSRKLISAIPAGSDVLVVNDEYRAAVDTIYSFYEVGLGDVKFIPFDEHLSSTGIYDKYKWALTPHEPELVPVNVEHVIDIGYRKIGPETLFSLTQLLDLESDRLDTRLFRHFRSVLVSEPLFIAYFGYNHLRSAMLRRITEKSPVGYLLVNVKFAPVYANAKARRIFGVADRRDINITDYIAPDDIRSDDILSEAVEIGGIRYRMEKGRIDMMGGIAGYFFEILTEADSSAKRRDNVEKGFIAKYTFDDINYVSAKMKNVIDTAKLIARGSETVLLRGESGVGKELIAQSIHNYSSRRNGPFVAINCAAIPETLLESELFGYEPGSFTGARSKGKAGLFEQADGGTIFLDEIGDISAGLQARLLRTIQEMQIMRIGSDKVIDIDVRIICATNRDLEKAIEAGAFRRDLFYRINVFPLIVPPLVQRKDDIMPLFESFVGDVFAELTDREKAILYAYDWPGNIRELNNVALYYSSLKQLPEYMLISNGAPRRDHDAGALARIDGQALRHHILTAIYDHTEPAHGIGRTALVLLLKDQGIKISDGKLRESLAELEKENLISVARGRGGTRITEHGSKYLLKGTI